MCGVVAPLSLLVPLSPCGSALQVKASPVDFFFFYSFGVNVRVCSGGREVERLQGTVRASELMGPHMGAVSV